MLFLETTLLLASFHIAGLSQSSNYLLATEMVHRILSSHLVLVLHINNVECTKGENTLLFIVEIFLNNVNKT